MRGARIVAGEGAANVIEFVRFGSGRCDALALLSYATSPDRAAAETGRRSGALGSVTKNGTPCTGWDCMPVDGLFPADEADCARLNVAAEAEADICCAAAFCGGCCGLCRRRNGADAWRGWRAADPGRPSLTGIASAGTEEREAPPPSKAPMA